MIRAGLAGLALALAHLSFVPPALAQGAGSHAGPVDGRPSIATFHIRPEEWAYRDQWQAISGSYRSALRFAECLHRVDPAATRAVLDQPIGHGGEMEALQGLAERHRGCVGEAIRLAPLLIRVAIAEIGLESTDRGIDGRLRGHGAVGVPETVDAYPLALVGRCHVRAAPDRVAAILATEPGSDAELRLAQSLFAAAPHCGSPVLGRLSPTAARLAFIDALHRRQFDARDRDGPHPSAGSAQ